MTSTQEKYIRAVQKNKRFEQAYGVIPNKLKKKEPLSRAEIVDHRLAKITTIISYLERFKTKVNREENKRRKGLAFVPTEGFNDAFHAFDELESIIQQLREEKS